MPGAIPPARSGEPVLGPFNTVVGAVNALNGFEAEGQPAEAGSGGRATAKAPNRRGVVLWKITSEFTIRDGDDVESCEVESLTYFPATNEYRGDPDDETQILYRVSAGADLIPGDHCHAWFNQQSGRWEIIAGGPGGSSSSSDVCRAAIGSVPIWTFPGYEAGVYQFLVKSLDNCIMLVTPGQCPTSGGGSSSSSESSSSSGAPSSSSSEETNDCEFCEPGDDLSAVTLQIISESFWNYANDRRYGTEGTLDIPYASQCGFITSVPLLSGDGFQQFIVEKVGPSLWRMYLNHSVDGEVAVWEKTDSSCCPGGSYARVSSNTVPDSEPWDFIFLYASGGPCE